MTLRLLQGGRARGPVWCLVLLLVACGTERTATTDTAHLRRPGAVADLTGAGATFPYPLYARWFGEWAQRTGVRINYQSIGSGGGVRQLTAGTVDFGASDVPLTAEEQQAMAPRRVLQVPTAVGAVAITYNLDGLAAPLRLSGSALAAIFDGAITRWNDPRLVALNPGVTLPARDVLVVYRADGGGTSFIMGSYLASVSPAWASRGGSKEVRWPVGIGGRGNEGVAAQVKAMEGAIGYIEVVYARQNRLPTAELETASGTFVAPTTEHVRAAADTATAGNTDPTRAAAINAPGPKSYPITSLTWLLLPLDAEHRDGTRELARFLRWALREGSATALDLGYVPLPDRLRDRVLAEVDAAVSGSPP
ncbi:MAG: phosphate ABC transporter substrate-binding protein PstS [Gemmatimonadaceae bacterium]|nr:phosphate ABC transporter substrate-binding protein PstS [Gemmatimonadaceae bacterium]